MRHKGINKEETRQKIIDAAGRGFRKNGYSGIGVDGLAKLAGVTSGAFYTHFGSKKGAFLRVLNNGLDEVIATVEQYQQQHGKNWVQLFTEYYLGKHHLFDMEGGCAMAALTSEVTRFDAEIRTAYEDKMLHIATQIAAGLTGGTDKSRQDRAWSMLSTLIGGVNIVRGMKGERNHPDVIKAIQNIVVQMAGPTYE